MDKSLLAEFTDNLNRMIPKLASELLGKTTSIILSGLDDEKLKEKAAQELSRHNKKFWTIDDYRNQAKQILSFIREEIQ